MNILNIHTKKHTERRPFSPALFFVLLFLSAFSLDAQDNYEIRKITFKGNNAFDKPVLLEQTSMRESDFWTKRIQKIEPAIYSHQFLEDDMNRIKTFYQSEGFLHTEISLDTLIVDNKKKRVNIRLAIVENRAVKVDSIIMSLTDSVSTRFNERRRQLFISRALNLKKGKRFSDNLLYEDISKINTLFVNRGYFYAKTDFDLELENDSVLIHYQVTPNSRVHIGNTTITGNKYIKEKYIRRQLNYAQGDVISQTNLNKTRSNIYNLQLFRIVSVSPQADRNTALNPIPIHIQIEEMPRISSKLGIGWGTEDSFRASADVTYRAVAGGTSRLNLYAKHSKLTPIHVSLSWIQPQLYFKKLSVSVNPYIKWEKEPGYNTQTIGLNFPLSYTFSDKLKGALTYYFERVQQNTEDSDAEIPNPEDNKFLYNKSGLYGSVVYNNASPVFSPEKGEMITAGGKLNGYLFGSDFNYMKVWIEARKYFKVKNLVIGLRGMFGGIYSSDDNGFIPVDDRFYSGGSNSNRGWARSQLGPKRESGTPLGGKSLLEANVELRHPLFWRVELAGFMDIANVWGDPFHYRFRELAVAAGGGIRITTPIGPIRLDVGVPLWNEKKNVQFFLSVGQAF
ncbi:MAG: BamA/TamA family outer membrane protein [Prevotellaceae bacterium]|nr:BamA/TamA family outer membrane protein [Prevotellaceae bacterium]